jgi:hypothetical protein
MLIKNYSPNLVNGSKSVVIGWFSMEMMNYYNKNVPTDDSTFLGN